MSEPQLVKLDDLPTEERDPALEHLRQVASVTAALECLRRAADRLAPAISRGVRQDGFEHFGPPEREAQNQVKNGYVQLGNSIDWLVRAQRSLEGIKL